MKKIALFLVMVLAVAGLVSCKDNSNKPCIEHVDKNNDGICDVCEEKLDEGSKEYEFKTPVTDSVKLTVAYEGKDFVEDGIGKATVVAFTDGDTAVFRTSGGSKVTVRFLGIDTPESTYKVDPWGFAASAYTKNALKNANEIVLQAEGQRVDSTGKRYLAWVWVDGRLLNLELAEVGLATADASGTSLSKEFINAIQPVMLAKERIYGEKNDPNFDYSNTREFMSIKELRDKYGNAEAINAQTDKGKKVSITGTIVRMMGSASAYIQQYNSIDGEYYGIYVYGGYGQIKKFKEGATVTIDGTIGYYYGQLQISSVTSASVKVHSYNNFDSVVARETKLEEIYITNYDLICTLISLNEEITITSAYKSDTSDTNAFTLRTNYRCSDGNYLDIRVDQNTNLVDESGNRITDGDSLVGKTIASFIGIVSYYDGGYGQQDPEQYDGHIQLLWTKYTDVVFK